MPQFEVLFDICLEGRRKTENRQHMGCAGRGLRPALSEALLLELTCLAGHVSSRNLPVPVLASKPLTASRPVYVARK